MAIRTKSLTTWTTWEDMPLDEFEKRAAKVKQGAIDLAALTDKELPGLRTMTAEQRAHAPKLRQGEHPMLAKVLDVADLRPALFTSIADQDEGMDPAKFETRLLRDRIEKHRIFGEITAELQPLAGHVSDSALYLSGQFREAVSAAYRIAKTHAMTDKGINDLLAPVIDFMRKAAVVRAANQTKNNKEKK